MAKSDIALILAARRCNAGSDKANVSVTGPYGLEYDVDPRLSEAVEDARARRIDRYRRRKTGNNYVRAGVITLGEGICFIENEEPVIMLFDHLIRTGSIRLKTFARDRGVCSICGLEGTHFAVESNTTYYTPKAYHLNLYAIDGVGDEVLMTRDHVHPKSKGGSNGLDNSQTACRVCNEKKGSKVDQHSMSVVGRNKANRIVVQSRGLTNTKKRLIKEAEHDKEVQ